MIILFGPQIGHHEHWQVPKFIISILPPTDLKCVVVLRSTFPLPLKAMASVSDANTTDDISSDIYSLSDQQLAANLEFVQEIGSCNAFQMLDAWC